MARRRFFVPEVRRGEAELSGAEAEHLVRVLRAEPGQIYELSDNQNLFLGEIVTARKSIVSFRIKEKLEPPPAGAAVTVAPALIKFDRFEWLIEKATELGVNVIQPFEAARSEHGLAQASQKRLARWEKIALEASQQSRRVHLPIIRPTVRLEKTLREDALVRLFLDESPEASQILSVLPAQRSAADRIALLVGPEGGWTHEEREQAVQAGWLPCSLAQTLLRAETASVAALAIIQAAWAVNKSN